MLVVFTGPNARRQGWLMLAQVKTPENGTKNIFRDKQTTNKVLLTIFDVKELTER